MRLAALLGPTDRLPRRLAQLLAGLVLYGWSMAMMVRSRLGLDPWDVFHYGLARHVPLTFGQVTIAVGAVVLLAWIPLRQRPGIGTLLNILVIGIAADLGLSVMASPHGLLGRRVLLVGGIVLNGLAGGLYVGAHLGPGPRDGLWVALTRRYHLSVRLVRTVIELTVLGVGWLMGGVVGVGTVLYALSIGHLNQFFLARLEVRTQEAEPAPVVAETCSETIQ
ncbi:MAG: hypothetical protein HY829_14695 [Actinobacteria bacterium]|nr:hypothetical protein [Actinomycetota bacterium]